MAMLADTAIDTVAQRLPTVATLSMFSGRMEAPIAAPSAPPTIVGAARLRLPNCRSAWQRNPLYMPKKPLKPATDMDV